MVLMKSHSDIWRTQTRRVQTAWRWSSTLFYCLIHEVLAPLWSVRLIWRGNTNHWNSRLVIHIQVYQFITSFVIFHLLRWGEKMLNKPVGLCCNVGVTPDTKQTVLRLCMSFSNINLDRSKMDMMKLFKFEHYIEIYAAIPHPQPSKREWWFSMVMPHCRFWVCFSPATPRAWNSYVP